jgi:hypothetical protein
VIVDHHGGRAGVIVAHHEHDAFRRGVSSEWVHRIPAVGLAPVKEKPLRSGAAPKRRSFATPWIRPSECC